VPLQNELINLSKGCWDDIVFVSLPKKLSQYDILNQGNLI